MMYVEFLRWLQPQRKVDHAIKLVPNAKPSKMTTDGSLESSEES